MTAALAAGLLLGPAFPARAADRPFDALLQGLEEAFQKRDASAYLRNFSADLRSREEDNLKFYSERLGLDTVTFEVAGAGREGEEGTDLFLHAYFSNPDSVLIENWILKVTLRDEGWLVLSKETAGSFGPLYKLRIPSGRAETVRSVEVGHRDIGISFDRAAVFYDNLPDSETALVIIGKGRVRFSPSDDNEKHQLELIFKNRTLEDDLDWVYLRCSSGFFASNIKIEREAAPAPVTAADEARAVQVFSRNYPRSFTVENPASREYLSFLPQGEEAVFELGTSRHGELAYIFSSFADEQVNLYDRRKKRVVALYNPVEPGGPERLKKMFVSFGEKFDVELYDLAADYFPLQSTLSVRARVHFRVRTENLNSLKFRFNPTFAIQEVRDERRNGLFYTVDRNRGLLYVYFMTPRKAGQAAFFEIVYSGKIIPPVPSSDNLGQAGTQSKLVFKPRFETFFFSSAGDWYPAPPEDDYFNCRLRLTAPAEYACVAVGSPSGPLSGEEAGPERGSGRSDRAVHAFTTMKPVKYISFLVGRIDRTKSGFGRFPVSYYSSGDLMDRRAVLFDQAMSILDFYEGLFGPYPFEKLDVVLRAWPRAGGFSPPSYIVLNEVPWDEEGGFSALMSSPVSLSRHEDFFLAHEIAHQWWGQGVSFATYRDQWLSEGLAQFAAMSYIREKYGRGAFLAATGKFAKWVERKTHMGPVSMGARLSSYDYDAYQAIVYNKAALALFLLEDILGRETMRRGLRSFLEAYRGRAARTQDFIRSMEEAAGRDLQAFFQGWFFSYELPSVQCLWSEEKQENGYLIKLRLVQTRGVFEFPLEVEWQEEGAVIRNRVLVDRTTQEFSWFRPVRPRRPKVNPGRLVPGRFF
jgi:hypothetical protein